MLCLLLIICEIERKMKGTGKFDLNARIDSRFSVIIDIDIYKHRNYFLSLPFLKKASVAQMVEQLTCNQWVGGSIPFAGSSWGEIGEVPERSKGADCKSAGAAFGGSNPPLSTRGTAQRRLDKGFNRGAINSFSFQKAVRHMQIGL
jgi:hypothetical protein